MRPLARSARAIGAALRPGLRDMVDMDRDFLIDLFSDFGPVTIRPMFSGFGISADGINFALALRAGLYFRADEQTIPQFEAEGSTPFSVPDAGEDRCRQFVLAVAGAAVRRFRRTERVGEGGAGGGPARGAAQASEGEEEAVTKKVAAKAKAAVKKKSRRRRKGPHPEEHRQRRCVSKDGSGHRSQPHGSRRARALLTMRLSLADAIE